MMEDVDLGVLGGELRWAIARVQHLGLIWLFIARWAGIFAMQAVKYFPAVMAVVDNG